MQGGHGGGVAVPGGQCLQQGRVVLGYHVQGVARAVGHATAGNVQLQVPGGRVAAVQAAAFENGGGKGVVFAIGGDLQAQVLASTEVAIQHLAEDRLPLLEELLVAQVGIHAVQQRLRLTLAQRRIQRLGEATEAGVAGVTKAEHRIAQAAQRRSLAQCFEELLAVGRRFAIAERTGNRQQHIALAEAGHVDVIEGEHLRRVRLQVRAQALGQGAGIARLGRETHQQAAEGRTGREGVHAAS
ncbi:hypothetical protein PGKDCPLP_03587 [Stenotrophomonas maltophilia]|nr:hypothetical protein PGKDCPLP_03587 [Stenotrophomonas maltophilia]